MKLTVERSSLGANLFADFYPGRDDRFLAIYFGGAGRPAAYEMRRASEPGAVLNEWRRATKSLAAVPSLLIVPAPLALIPDRQLLAKEIVNHVVCELLPAAGVALQEDVGCVGLSYGAMLATGFAGLVSSCRRVATLGGVGMVEIAQASGGTALKRCGFRCFVNEDDPAEGASKDFVSYAASEGAEAGIERSAGGHVFVDYAVAGAVARAFTFVVAGPRAQHTTGV